MQDIASALQHFVIHNNGEFIIVLPMVINSTMLYGWLRTGKGVKAYDNTIIHNVYKGILYNIRPFNQAGALRIIVGPAAAYKKVVLIQGAKVVKL